MPVVVVCEDLVSMRRVLVAEGPFGEVLRAAIAIPALFEPVELAGLTLIDGGITNLVPLEPFAGLNEAVISATAFYNRDLEPKDPFTIFTMAVNIGKSRTAVQDLRRFQPLLIRTDVEEFSFMGWHQLALIQGRGYDSCAERIGELRAYLERSGVPLALPEPLRAAALRRGQLPGREGIRRPAPGFAQRPGFPAWGFPGPGRGTGRRPCSGAGELPFFHPGRRAPAGPLQLPFAARQPGTGRGRVAIRRAFPAGRATGAAAGR